MLRELRVETLSREVEVLTRGQGEHVGIYDFRFEFVLYHDECQVFGDSHIRQLLPNEEMWLANEMLEMSVWLELETFFCEIQLELPHGREKSQNRAHTF